MILTKHFVDNWKLRVSNGIPPNEETVKGVVAGAIQIQKGRVFTLANGKQFKTLSFFWNPDLKIMVSVDPVTNHAVSVATDTMKDGQDENRKRKSKKVMKQSREPVSGYVQMTLHGLTAANG